MSYLQCMLHLNPLNDIKAKASGEYHILDNSSLEVKESGRHLALALLLKKNAKKI